MNYKIFIVEDNKVISDNISEYLKLEWFLTNQFFEWKNIIFEIINNKPDLIILDLWLPDIDWIELCKNIRNKWFSIPILILTARTTTNDKIIWLENWADDYLVKPFSYEELIARIKALLRRSFSNKSSNIIIGNININSDEKKVIKNNVEIHLSNIEFDLLLYLAQNKWKILEKEELLEKVWWEYDEFWNSRTVDVYIWYLRKKLWNDLIETKRWKWYLINSKYGQL